MVHRTFAIETGNGRKQTDLLRRTSPVVRGAAQSGTPAVFRTDHRWRLWYGIYVMLASNREEAKAIAAQDSHHLRGIRTMEVLEWDPRRAFRMLTIADVAG